MDVESLVALFDAREQQSMECGTSSVCREGGLLCKRSSIGASLLTIFNIGQFPSHHPPNVSQIMCNDTRYDRYNFVHIFIFAFGDILRTSPNAIAVPPRSTRVTRPFYAKARSLYTAIWSASTIPTPRTFFSLSTVACGASPRGGSAVACARWTVRTTPARTAFPARQASRTGVNSFQIHAFKTAILTHAAMLRQRGGMLSTVT